MATNDSIRMEDGSLTFLADDPGFPARSAPAGVSAKHKELDMEPKVTDRIDGVAFELTTYWQFYVPSLDKTFESYKELREGIERHKKALTTVKRDKLSLPVIGDDGIERVLTGIHAGHGHIVSTPQGDRYGSVKYLPRESWIVGAIAEMAGLRVRIHAIEDILTKFRIAHEKGYDRYDVANHADRLAWLRKDFDEKSKDAKNVSFASEMASVKPRKKLNL